MIELLKNISRVPFINLQIESDCASEPFELDWNVFDRHIQKAIELVPIFQKAGIKSTVCGAEAFTPDHKPLVGELFCFYF